jgi:hypothetical protein
VVFPNAVVASITCTVADAADDETVAVKVTDWPVREAFTSAVTVIAMSPTCIAAQLDLRSPDVSVSIVSYININLA